MQEGSEKNDGANVTSISEYVEAYRCLFGNPSEFQLILLEIGFKLGSVTGSDREALMREYYSLLHQH